jgi:hypothetical protein
MSEETEAIAKSQSEATNRIVNKSGIIEESYSLQAILDAFSEVEKRIGEELKGIDIEDFAAILYEEIIPDPDSPGEKYSLEEISGAFSRIARELGGILEGYYVQDVLKALEKELKKYK